MVAFENLNTDAGLAKLNKHLESLSYISGYQPTKEDFDTFASVGTAPDAKKYPHANRWYKHIASYSDAEKQEALSAAPAPSAAPAKPAKDEDDIDLFGDDDEDAEEQKKELEKRKKEIEDKKAAAGKKPAPIMKSAVNFDVKPYDDETDLKLMEEKVRSIQLDGLEWKASKLVEVAYGIKKLVITAHVVDDVASTEDIEDRIREFEDIVQSVDISQFTKL